jgi:hypothetical protein
MRGKGQEEQEGQGTRDKGLEGGQKGEGEGTKDTTRTSKTRMVGG